MKKGKVVVIGSNDVRVELQSGSTGGAIVFLLSVVVGVFGAVKIYQMHTELQKAKGSGIDSGNRNIETIQ